MPEVNGLGGQSKKVGNRSKGVHADKPLTQLHVLLVLVEDSLLLFLNFPDSLTSTFLLFKDMFLEHDSSGLRFKVEQIEQGDQQGEAQRVALCVCVCVCVCVCACAIYSLPTIRNSLKKQKSLY